MSDCLESGYYRVFNYGQFKHLGTGYRYVYAEVGRKWVRLIEWASGDTCRALIKSKGPVLGWTDSEPEACEPPRLKILRRCIKRFGTSMIAKAAVVNAQVQS